MDVFVYGTLTEPEQVATVVDSYAFLGSAVLSGLHPVQGDYPTLAPGGETGGRLLRTDDVDALDAYEGVGDGLYVRVTIPVEDVDSWEVDRDDEADLDAAASVYVGDPERLGVADEVVWPAVDGEAVEFAERVRQYVRRNDVRVRPQ
jgi:gamma-glutamylcyclotransferase (GGCT)/AIG2-like uncharacterized protein YtfP